MLFSPVVGCELNVNACKHDVTSFISFVPVRLFHFVSGSFTDAVQSKNMYSHECICMFTSSVLLFVHTVLVRSPEVCESVVWKSKQGSFLGVFLPSNL